MSSQRAIRRTLSLMLALSIALWAEDGLAMLTADHGAQCHSRMSHTQQQAHPMPCCPMHAASVPSSFFEPPTCCDLSNQPARPLAFLVISGKSRSSQLGARSAAAAMFVPSQRSSAFFLIADSPPFVKPVFDKKTDLRI